MKVSGSKYIFLVLYVNDILLAANDTDMLVEQLLFSHFDMKDLGEASYVLSIQILRDRPSGVLKLFQQTYIVRAPPPGPLRRGVVPLTGYRGMSHALFFRLRESLNPRPKGHIEMGSTLTTN